MNELLNGDIWSQVNERMDDFQKKTACIAHVTSGNLKLTKGDILVCNASDSSIRQGNTAAKILNFYQENGVKVYTNTDLHSKLLLTNRFVVVGSSNLSRNSAENLVESAIISDNSVLISQASAFCHNLINESFLLTKEEIERLSTIEVIKRPQEPFTKSKVRNKEFGNSYWILPTQDLSERIVNSDKVTVDRSTKEIIKSRDIIEDSIGYIRLTGTSTFIKTVKEGDQVIQDWSNKTKSRRILFPPATILRIERLSALTYFHYDNSTLESGISWTSFKSEIKDLELEKGFENKRTRKISLNDMRKLSKVWE